MKLDTRYSNHPTDSKHYTTDQLREHYLIESVFAKDEVLFTYSHYDRIIAGGVMPVEKTLELAASSELGVEFFLERREMGVINVGGAGSLELDGKVYDIAPRDGMYVGMGVKSVKFTSNDPKNPAKFYINSCPAHESFPTVEIKFEKANPVHLGEQANLNKRTIYQYVHPAVCQSCQLVMGMTLLAENNVWNTMPCHTHERRMEVYYYFDMKEDTRIFHMMGEPTETRHIVMKNDQAVISPSWSIHSGVGTSNYTFIWGMCGENKTFTDMDHVAMETLK
ncbi:MAG: 5-dehydro-4-deoxy-D-glucuronate isomerase [Spirochaetaceae bacterium]